MKSILNGGSSLRRASVSRQTARAKKQVVTVRLHGAILSLCLLIGAVPVGADQVASIVYGSFTSRPSAESYLRAMEFKLGQSLQITKTDVDDKKYFRVSGLPRHDISALRLELQQVQASSVPDAWLLVTPNDPIPRTSVPEQSVPADNGQVPVFVTEQNVEYPVEQESQPELTRTNDSFDLSSNQEQFYSSPFTIATESLQIPKFEAVDITIDGILYEQIWDQVQGYDNMSVIEPDTLVAGRYGTETRFLYTDKGLYISVNSEQPRDTLIPRLSSRDQSINRDGIEITLDTTGEGLYGYWFGVNLGGSLIDGVVLPERDVSKEWDGPWQGDARETDTGWSSELFLPWSMMSMPDAPAERNMSIFVSRKVAHLDETWSWPALPLTGSKFMSSLQPITLQQIDPSQQVSVFPYSSAIYNNLGEDTDYRMGADLFWRPSSNLQVTLGINPDFGTVESDDVVINLTAFESFFPEKRLFFLEGIEIFVTTPRSSVAEQSTGSSARRTAVNFNPEPTTLVNTRRIGGAPRRPNIPADAFIPGTELGKPTELYGAGKVTGQSGAFRYGVMAAFEKDSKFNGIDSDQNPVRLMQDGRDFGVARFLYEDTTDGRRSLGWISTLVSHPEEDAIVHGIDAHYLSPSGKLKFDSQLMYSDVNDVTGAGGFLDLLYIPRRGVSHMFKFDYFDETLDVNDLGFIRRNDAVNLLYAYNYSTSNLKRLRGRSNQVFLSQEYNTDGLVVRSGVFWRTTWTLHNLSQIRTEFDYFPSRWDDRNSRGNGIFRIPVRLVSEISYGTDTSKQISISLAAGRRQEDSGGWRTTAKGGITYKPNDRFSFDLDVNYARRDGWLIHQEDRRFTTFDATDWQPSLSMGVFFTARQQLRLTMQWAGIRADEKQFFVVPDRKGSLVEVEKDPGAATDDFTISRITAQLRYRWEIAPLSDLFIVYTRGGDLPNQVHDEFDDLFHDSLTDPVLDFFVVKLRYRFGN
jgi:hypothetical protein